jgi:hypothetical protein
MIDEFAKAYLHDDLRWIRDGLLAKLDGKKDNAEQDLAALCAQPRTRREWPAGYRERRCHR